MIWLLENPTGQAIWAIPLAALFFLPVKWLGFWWVALIIVAGLAFAFGWNAARRRWLRDGHIDKL
ncbi:hypothetical protein CSC64_06585 [Pseudoxanthomonas koreensis]|nr:hypothetical protein CSC64_06585 [Pseudoxanthomonas koreensis]